jgi:hypothetical protein
LSLRLGFRQPNDEETRMSNLLFDSPRFRNPGPVTSHEAAIGARIRAEVYFPKIVECLKANGPLAQEEIAAAKGIAETSCSPLLRPVRRAGVPEEVGRNPAKACPRAGR